MPAVCDSYHHYSTALSFPFYRLHRLLKLAELLLKLRVVAAEFDGFLLGSDGLFGFAGVELGGGQPVENSGVPTTTQLRRSRQVVECAFLLAFQSHAAADVVPARLLSRQMNGSLGVLPC